MAYEQRDNSGSLFKNDKKQEGDSKPNMSGKAMIDGVMYFFDAWTKTTQAGDRWQSVSFKRMDSQAAPAPAPAPAARPAPKPAPVDDDIPF